MENILKEYFGSFYQRFKDIEKESFIKE